ncbi:hypothetical protein E2562_019911 [Oryza meyeriana var. granulata]|uniref:Uncharacterized protein n=1 Tax=Oryza meyeriana var. granulata TaxID=110450 RepID=A0A6G1EXL4_9ORYZ|nr:hypothetical protein E2562_019911 [Oryza meyeriana var. granulata]
MRRQNVVQAAEAWARSAKVSRRIRISTSISSGRVVSSSSKVILLLAFVQTPDLENGFRRRTRFKTEESGQAEEEGGKTTAEGGDREMRALEVAAATVDPSERRCGESGVRALRPCLG